MTIKIVCDICDSIIEIDINVDLTGGSGGKNAVQFPALCSKCASVKYVHITW